MMALLEVLGHSQQINGDVLWLKLYLYCFRGELTELHSTSTAYFETDLADELESIDFNFLCLCPSLNCAMMSGYLTP